MPYANPVLPGFHPDPSVCRVGDDYYLATSSFEYFPAVPLYHSRDLVHWRAIGHALARDSQLDLRKVASSEGIFAPTLRHHRGRFYLVTTAINAGGHLLVHSENPAGPWSDPLWIEGGGFDPDLFFDDDGSVYFQREDFFGHGIRQWRIDLSTGRLLGEQRLLWDGQEDPLVEGPHLYKVGGRYYLLAAEGGTHRGHMITVARSDSPTGPFTGCPRNPILTHRHLALHPVQATGHGDLVQSPDGRWWILFLGIRQKYRYGPSHHLGRETFLAPLTWDEQGWPVVNGGKPVELQMESQTLAPHPWPAAPPRDDFDEPFLAMCWNFRRNPDPGCWSLTQRPGHLRLMGLRTTLDEAAPVAFVGRRQEHFDCHAEALLDFRPRGEEQEAGLTALANESHHYELAVGLCGGRRVVRVRRRIGDLSCVVIERPLKDGPVCLRIVADERHYRFFVTARGEAAQELASASVHHLSSEVAGTFTGVYLGMYAVAGQEATPADFDWFDYRGQ